MVEVGRKSILLMLLGVDGAGVNGITRLQKLLYLLEREEGLKIGEGGFAFTAYKMGPYSSKLYDDLELMENLGWIGSSPVANPTEEEREEAELSFDDLIGDSSTQTADVAEERRYHLSDKGLARAQELLDAAENREIVSKIRRVKSKFSTYSLHDLLVHVYTKYPESTTASEIRDQVLGRRPRG